MPRQTTQKLITALYPRLSFSVCFFIVCNLLFWECPLLSTLIVAIRLGQWRYTTLENPLMYIAWATVLQRTGSCRCRNRRLQGHFYFLRISAASGGCSWWAVPSALGGYCSRIPGLCTALCRRRFPMKRFVKCFFELLTENFSAWRETGQKKGRKTRLWTFRSRFRE